MTDRTMRLAAGLLLAATMVSSASAADKSPDLDPGYDQARWDPVHFKPAIDSARDEQCLECHKEVLEPSVSAESPAGVKAGEALAWYQTLDTYAGEQESFHRRHLVTDHAKRVMDLKCNTCHQGNDPRDETANSSADASGELTQRKHVDPGICLMCHGEHNAEIMGVPPGDWLVTGAAFQFDCLLCHAVLRTTRHQVNFLKPDAIEAAAKENKDVCFGCHGGRAWYRTVYPYPRHPWPGSSEKVPEWAKDRPTESDPRFLVGMDKSGRGSRPE